MIARLFNVWILKRWRGNIQPMCTGLHKDTAHTYVAPASSHHLTPGWLNGRAIHATGVPHSEQRSPRELELRHKLHFLHN